MESAACQFAICILAIYGAIVLISGLVKLIRFEYIADGKGIRLALMVKNREDAIEGVVRSIAGSGILKMPVTDGRLAIVDLGSDDDTPRILEKIKKDYEYIDIIHKDEKERLFAIE